MKLSLDSSSLFLLIFVMLLIILGKYHWSRRHLYIFAAKLPGPFVLPLVGNGLEFLGKKEDMLNVTVKITEPYSSPSKIWLGPRLVVFIKDADQLQIVLGSSKITTKSFIYRFLEPFLGKGLITSAGNVHKQQRRIIQPFFSQRVLDGYSHLFQKHAKKFVENIRKHVNGDEFDILLYLHDSAFETTMDILLEDKNDHAIDYRDIPCMVRRFYHLFFTRVTSFWLHPDFIYKKTSYFKEQDKMSRIITIMTQELMGSRVSKVIDRLVSNQIIDEDTKERAPSMLEMMVEMLIEDSSRLTEKEFIDHMVTFVAASQDTQSSAMAFTCMMLGVYPHIQERVLKELTEVLGNRKELDLTDVSQLKYLDMCIKESMRLFPVAPYVFRDTTEDFPLGKLVIPKDVTVAIGIYNVHRDPNHWEKPTEYYPEHFLPEAVSKRHPYAYIPFSAGPRRCIAQQYSYTNMTIIIATLLLNYELQCERTLENIKLMTDISVRPVDGYLVKIKPRKMELERLCN